MKKVLKTSIRAILLVALSMLFFQTIIAQELNETSWEGMFMNDFKVVLTIPSDNTSAQQGTIKMYAGNNMIQDDALTRIILTANSLEFYIPAKQTLFSGEIQPSGTDVIGYFIFPDSSRHPLQVHKIINKSSTTVEPEFREKRYFSAQELQSDMDYLHCQLKEYHPQLHAYTSQKSMERQFRQLKSQLNTPLVLDEFYQIAAQFTDLVHCSHTGVRVSPVDQSNFNQVAHFFPLQLYFDEGKAYYVPDPKVEIRDIQSGAEILSINNQPVNEIIAQLFPLIPAEGLNQTTKYVELNRRFQELFLYLDETESYLISYRDEEAIKGMTIPASIEKVFKQPSRKEHAPVNYSEDSGLPVLKVSSFAIGNINEYIDQLDQIVEGLIARQVHDVALDLRGNAGGHPIFAAQLLSYFVSDSFTYFKRNEAIQEFEPLYNVMPANRLHFEGNLYVLVDGGSLSTTGHLISLLNQYTDAVFVGETPGSTYQCNDFSSQIRLPNTGLEVNIPKTTFETSVVDLPDKKPFRLDYPVKPSIEDIIKHGDPYLQKITSIVEEKKHIAQSSEL